MPGFLLHAGSILRCSHGGEATPTTSNPRIIVSGQPIVSQDSDFVIAGCTLPQTDPGADPCVTARFVTAASRVRANGLPVLLHTSQAVCMPTGTPLHIVQTQTRVTAI
jgi:hypothetical protein